MWMMYEVVDEADRLVNKWRLYQRRVRHLQEKEDDPAVMVLKAIEFETSKAILEAVILKRWILSCYPCWAFRRSCLI